jgi:ABC-type antimicrobial peptide transport system permease subunit
LTSQISRSTSKTGASSTLLDELGFAKKDFKHRKFETFLALTGLIICVASTTFLLQTGLALWLPNISRGNVKPTSFLVNATLTFVRFDTLLVFLIGMLTVFFLTSTLMSNRVHDIGLIKAMGSNNGKDHSYIMSGPLLIILLGCFTGAAIGTASFTLMAFFFLQINLLQIIISITGFVGVFILTFLIAWFIAGYQIENTFKTTTITSLAGDTNTFDFKKEQLVALKKLIKRLPFSVQTVTRGILRSRTKSKTALICLSASLLLLTVSFVGGFVSWYTTRDYVDKAFGQNVLAIGNQQVTAQYVDLLQPTLNPQNTQINTFNFLNTDFVIDNTFIQKLTSNSQAMTVDSRLVAFAQITEIENFTIENEPINNEQHYRTIGDHRTTRSLIVGIDPEKTVNNPETQRSERLIENEYTIAIGDAVARNLFEDPYQEKLNISANSTNPLQEFSISNVAVDPLNQGNTVYLSLQTMQNLFSVNGTNLILVKTQETSQAYQEITNLANQYNLTVTKMNIVHAESLANVDRIWLSVLPFPFMSMITTGIGFLNALSVSMAGRMRDFGIIRAIGAKPNYLTRTILLETVIFLLLSAPTGIILGMMFNFIFLIPSATLTLPILALSLTALAITLLAITGLTTVITVRIFRKSPTTILQETN